MTTAKLAQIFRLRALLKMHLTCAALLASYSTLAWQDRQTASKDISSNLKPPINLEFIGEASLAQNYMFKNTKVGGLSGIDYDPISKNYYVISDDRAEKSYARFYTLSIQLSDGKLSSKDIQFTEVTEIQDKNGKRFSPGSVDPESIRLNPNSNTLYWTSEGDAKTGKAPIVRIMNLEGKYLGELTTPAKYTPRKKYGIRDNLAFESLSISYSGEQIFTATENALFQDGKEATTTNGSDSRLLEFNLNTGKASAEYVYENDPVAEESIPPGSLEVSGIVELLAISHNTFISLERSFSKGAGNTIRLYLINKNQATNVLTQEELKNLQKFSPLKKQLILDLSTLNITLDNIEGMTFGPTLPGGEKTLILVSDDNFSKKQKTQFLAFKIYE